MRPTREIQYQNRTYVLKGMKISLFLFLVLISLSSFAQKEKPMNYRRFDERTLHFGFMLGFNSASFTAYPVEDAYAQFGLKSLIINSQQAERRE